MAARIHFFALADDYATWMFCGDFREGDGWTALPRGVTCAECLRRLEAFAAQKRPVVEAAEEHPA